MSLTRRRFGLAAVALALCSGAAAAADKLTVAIGQRGAWDTSVTAQGIEQGFFKEENLEIEMIWTQGSAEQIQAVITGSAQIGIGIGTLGAIASLKRGAPFKIVGSKMTGAPDTFWYVRADSPIRSMKDTEGKTVAYSRPGSSAHLVILNLAKEAKVNPKLVSTGAAPGTRTQVMSGQIDVAWSIPPFALDLVRKGEARIIARGADEADLRDVSIRVNIANSNFMAQKREIVQRYFKVYQKTIDWMYANQDKSVAFFAKMNEIPIEIAREGFEYFPKDSMRLTPVSGLEKSLGQALEFKLIESPMPLDQLQKAVDLIGN